jgi:hypothetical protein
MDSTGPTRLGRQSPLIKAKLRAKDPPRLHGFAELTTLFLVSLKKNEALELLEGLSDTLRQKARVFAQQVSDLDSATRQARLMLEFGTQPQAKHRAAALMAEAPALLKAAIAEALPPELKPKDAPPAHPQLSPAIVGLAQRLVREALGPVCEPSSDPSSL